MLNDAQMSEIAIRAVQDAQHARGASELHVRSRVQCFGGKLYVIAGTLDPDQSRFENFVFFSGDDWELMYNTAEVVKRLDQGIGDPAFVRTLRSAFSLNAMAGIIAILMTITIVAIVWQKPDAHVPDLLANALTTILGFYFGTQTSRVAK